jgi:hypothetical protein
MGKYVDEMSACPTVDEKLARTTTGKLKFDSEFCPRSLIAEPNFLKSKKSWTWGHFTTVDADKIQGAETTEGIRLHPRDPKRESLDIGKRKEKLGSNFVWYTYLCTHSCFRNSPNDNFRTTYVIYIAS